MTDPGSLEVASITHLTPCAKSDVGTGEPCIAAARALPADDLTRFDVRIVRAEELPEWDGALSSSPQRCPFLRTDWLHAIAVAHGRELALIGCFEGQRLVGGVAGYVSEARDQDVKKTELTADDSKPRLRLERIDLAAYGGVWVAAAANESPQRSRHRHRAIQTALARSLPNWFTSAEFDCHPANGDIRPFTWNQWEAKVRYTYVSDLRSLETAAIDSDVRRRARRAQENGVRFESNLSPDEFDRVWTATHERQRIQKPLKTEEITHLLSSMNRWGGCRIFGARTAAGQMAAATVILCEGATAYYWLAGYDASLAHTGANQFCLLEMLRIMGECANQLDWVGANTPGIAEFKETLGPQLVPYYRISFRRKTMGDGGPGIQTGLRRFARRLIGRNQP